MQKCHEYTLVDFQKTYGFEEELIFDWSQMAALFFRAHGASRMRTCTIQNSNQIKQKQKTFKQIFRGKSGAEKTSTNTFVSGNSGFLNKQKVYR